MGEDSTKLKYEGALTISRPSGGGWDGDISIRIRCNNSHATFVEVKVSAADLMLALTGRAEVDMSFNVRALDKVGKHSIMKDITVELPKDLDYNERPKKAHKLALKQCEGTGWIPSEYYGAKSSYSSKDGKEFAHTHANKYLTDEEYAEYKEQNVKTT